MTKHSDIPMLKEAAIAVASNLYYLKWIAATIGVSEPTIHKWVKEDKEFLRRLNQERAKFIKGNMRKAKPEFLLETADRETFGRKTEVNVNLDFRDRVIASYGAVEGKIDEVPRIEEIKNRPSESST